MAQTWEEERGPNYLSPHCASGACTFCRTRRERRRAAMLRDLIACAKPSTDLSPWNTPITPRRTQTSSLTLSDRPYPSTVARQVWHMKDPSSRNKGHRLTPKRWR